MKWYYEQLYASKFSALDERDKWLGKCNLKKPRDKEIEKFKLIFMKEIAFVTEHFSTNKTPGPESFSGEFFCIFKGKDNSNSTQTFLENRVLGNTSLLFMGPALLWYQNQLRIL